MNFLDPSPGLVARFQGFARGLYRVIANYTGEHPSSRPLIEVICKRLMRRSKRFAALFARFEAGTLPPPRIRVCARVPAGRAPPDAAKRARAPDPVPRRPGYLLELGKHEAAYYLGILEILVADPQMVALLGVSPQAGRLLRPLWRMLNPRPLPDILRPPPRPPASSAPEAAPARPAAGQEFAPTSYVLPSLRGLRMRSAGPSGFGRPIPA